jgi:hypothetical protein
MIALAAFVALAGCEGGSGGPVRPDAATGSAPTYHADVAPLMRRECLSCHLEDGVGPFPLDTYERVREHAESVVDAVESGYMPPWLPDRACREYAGARGLDDAERDVFARWLAGGMRRGDPADAPPPPEDPPELVETDVARMVEPYTPDPTQPDDYRCFLLDHTFEDDAFLTGSEVVPGAASLVHHVLVYGVGADQVAGVEAADAADAGPGYTCFGSPIPNADRLIMLGAWVPGMVPDIAGEGRGIYVPAGGRIVMQVHYNLLSGDPAPDSTEYHMEVTETEPERHLTTFATYILDLDIPAGEPHALHRATFRSYRTDPIRLTAVGPHMHLLGTQIGGRLLPARDAEGEPECLVDIPRWDFDWQQGYRFREDDPVVLGPGEGIELTCVYDNSETNQPVFNGERVEPRDVSWGEGSLDEMCLLYVQHEEPWTGPPPQGCDALDGCMASCGEGEVECLLRCEGLGSGCRICAVDGTLGCARDACSSAFEPAEACIQSCRRSYVVLGGSFERCMRTECGDAWPGVIECVSEIVADGTCDDELSACGISL